MQKGVFQFSYPFMNCESSEDKIPEISIGLILDAFGAGCIVNISKNQGQMINTAKTET